MRILYECTPLAFLAERFGDKASDGKNCILDIMLVKLN
jgi:fructose-1,6-bisphosphatase